MKKNGYPARLNPDLNKYQDYRNDGQMVVHRNLRDHDRAMVESSPELASPAEAAAAAESTSAEAPARRRRCSEATSHTTAPRGAEAAAAGARADRGF